MHTQKKHCKSAVCRSGLHFICLALYEQVELCHWGHRNRCCVVCLCVPESNKQIIFCFKKQLMKTKINNFVSSVAAFFLHLWENLFWRKYCSWGLPEQKAWTHAVIMQHKGRVSATRRLSESSTEKRQRHQSHQRQHHVPPCSSFFPYFLSFPSARLNTRFKVFFTTLAGRGWCPRGHYPDTVVQLSSNLANLKSFLDIMSWFVKPSEVHPKGRLRLKGCQTKEMLVRQVQDKFTFKSYNASNVSDMLRILQRTLLHAHPYSTFLYPPLSFFPFLPPFWSLLPLLSLLGMIWSLSLQGCITSVLSPNTSWRSLQTFHHSTFPESASWSPYVSQITVSATISPPYCCLFDFFTVTFFTLAVVRHLFCSTETLPVHCRF